MKNIYLLPTQNNKSKLAIYHYEGSKNIKVGEIGLQVNNNIGWTHCWSERELYITSEEEIKEGDWVLVGYVLRHPDTKNRFNGDTSPIKKLVKKGDLWQFTDGTNRYGSTCKKIILTTDPDLIKDKVLAIPEEILEWFVKNSSCEEVEVEKIYLSNNGKWKDVLLPSEWEGNTKVSYKIVTPKKESKTNLEKLQFPELVGELTKYYKKVPLIENSVNLFQETLEEAAERIPKEIDYREFDLASFKLGIRWQKTRSYTYEEMKESFSKGHDSARLKGSYKSNESFEEDWESWAKQFKKEHF